MIWRSTLTIYFIVKNTYFVFCLKQSYISTSQIAVTSKERENYGPKMVSKLTLEIN